MIAAVRVWMWARRLAFAKGFAHDLEQTIIRERVRARADVEYCEVELSRARRTLVEERANRKLRGATRTLRDAARKQA